MREEFLHYVWKFKRFEGKQLATTKGAPVSIINFGQHNYNAGPDFLNARVKIGDTLWAGNIEIHVNASDWSKHNHQNDDAYNNVILHVVYSADEEAYTNSGAQLPVLELQKRIDSSLYSNYKKFLRSKHWVPCQQQVEQLGRFIVNSWLDRLTIERLERKTTTITAMLASTKCDWNEVFYRVLARNFGFKINAHQFEMLAAALPLKYLQKQKNSLLCLEALLFGQAGMLSDQHKDAYPVRLAKEYQFLQQKYQLTPINKSTWKFLRLRPNNFPTIRIAQLAKLLYNSTGLFAQVMEISHIENLFHLFNVEANDYWETHFTFGKPSKRKLKQLGRAAIENIIINTIVPFLFVYGKEKRRDEYCERAIHLLEQLAAEKNNIVARWSELGVRAENAFQSQALIELKNEYCSRKKCLNCNIGIFLLKH